MGAVVPQVALEDLICPTPEDAADFIFLLFMHKSRRVLKALKKWPYFKVLTSGKASVLSLKKSEDIATLTSTYSLDSDAIVSEYKWISVKYFMT